MLYVSVSGLSTLALILLITLVCVLCYYRRVINRFAIYEEDPSQLHYGSNLRSGAPLTIYQVPADSPTKQKRERRKTGEPNEYFYYSGNSS